MFEIVTLNFDLVLEYFNFANNFKPEEKARAFIFHTCIPCDNAFHMILLAVTLTFNFYLLPFLNNFNASFNFHKRRDRVFIFNIFIPCNKTWYQIFLPVTMTLNYELLLKTLILAKTWLLFNDGFYRTSLFVSRHLLNHNMNRQVHCHTRTNVSNDFFYAFWMYLANILGSFRCFYFVSPDKRIAMQKINFSTVCLSVHFFF